MTNLTYSTLLLDLDHTLFDSNASEALAFEQTLGLAGLANPNDHLPTYTAINGPLWAAVERGEITTSEVRMRRFEQLIAALGLDADPAVMADNFVAGLANYGELYPGVKAVLDNLAGRTSLSLVTNGLQEVQRRRIERLGIGRYFDAVVISSEVNAAKPSTKIFDIAFERLGGPAKQTTLIVGDSLTSDMQGGRNYSIATCWYNRHGDAANPTGPGDLVDHEITDLDQLPSVVGGAPVVGQRLSSGERGSSGEDDCGR